MKRFLTFGGSNYYPEGGIRDFVIDSDTWQGGALAVKDNPVFDWWHVYDTDLKKIIVSQMGTENHEN